MDKVFLSFQGQFLKAEKRHHPIQMEKNSSIAFWCIKMYVSISARNQATNRIKGGHHQQNSLKNLKNICNKSQGVHGPIVATKNVQFCNS